MANHLVPAWLNDNRPARLFTRSIKLFEFSVNFAIYSANDRFDGVISIKHFVQF